MCVCVRGWRRGEKAEEGGVFLLFHGTMDYLLVTKGCLWYKSITWHRQSKECT